MEGSWFEEAFLSKTRSKGLIEVGVAGLFVILPIVGLMWLITYNPLTTVDGLFTALVLLTISGVFGLDVLLELRQMGYVKMPGDKGKSKVGSPASPIKNSVASGSVPTRQATSSEGSSSQPVVNFSEVESDRGLVREIQFFEADVGQANKSLVTLLPDGSNTPKNLMFVGNVQNLIPLGERVELTSRSKDEVRTLLECRHLY